VETAKRGGHRIYGMAVRGWYNTNPA
jgi:hypothetical protein